MVSRLKPTYSNLLKRIKWVGFPPDQYFKEEHPKTQIVLHHTASGRGANGDWQWWLSTPSRIATFLIIDDVGVPFQLFKSKYWGYHLGLRNRYNKIRNQQTVAIEIDSWGPLAHVNGEYFSYTGTKVDASRVQTYSDPFRVYPKSDFFDRVGVTNKPCYIYEKYSDAALGTLQEMLLYLCEHYTIPRNYNSDMWVVNNKAIQGEPGIWSHVSYRQDKGDCHPQPELIKMLKSLTRWTG